MLRHITLLDTNISGSVSNRIIIEVNSQILTVAEIIRLRINQEVDNFNKSVTTHFQGLVALENLEATLNGYTSKKKQVVDAEKQLYVALDAFQKNQFFILINDKQVESLDQEFQIDESTQISFIKLVPLVGG